MRVHGKEFEHDRQAVDACLDLLYKEGLSGEAETRSLGDALMTLCERLEIEANVLVLLSQWDPDPGQAVA